MRAAMQIVEVVWDDAHVSTSEITKKEAIKLGAERTRTVAYLVAENDNGVVLATDIYEKDPSVGKIINFIPWDIIVSYEELVK